MLLAKRPRISAPMNPADVIDITSTEDEAPPLPPPEGTQPQPVIALRYDADGSILIDDDDEPMGMPAPVLLPKIKKPVSATASGQCSVYAAPSQAQSNVLSVQVREIDPPLGSMSRRPT